MSKILDGNRKTEQQKESHILKSIEKLNFDKTFEDLIENELEFHGYGTGKIEIQQQPDDKSPFTCKITLNFI